MLAYRASIHTTTRYTPAYLTFGRELRLPLELLSPIPPLEALSMPEHVRNLRENLRTAFTMAQGHMKDAQRRQKEQYDQHVNGPVYPVGCRVVTDRPKQRVVGDGTRNLMRSGMVPLIEVLSCARFNSQLYVIVILNSALVGMCVTVALNQLKYRSSHTTSIVEPCELIVPPGCISNRRADSGNPTGRRLSQCTCEWKH
ncbi:hypothetical protein AHF37_00897 [Paragonimus kellicotti]|nr:hypothetical protein AHF37_00897 [Paragonimus kellicotti]